ncbi:MAG: SIMPL domain-containing protein [Acidobacteria bacterium]|nr:SIMPL domain-containing protein [Acidobacteriota bacterium]
MSLRRTAASIALPATLLLALLGAATATGAQTPVGGPGVIVATGESIITVAPDQALAMVSVDTRDSRGPEARRLGAVAMTSMRAALAATGLAADAVQTAGFALHPEYDYTNDRQRITGFVVSNRLQVRIDDVMKVADVLDAVAGLPLPSSSTVTIADLRFDLKDRAGVERQALRQAVQDSTERATAMALGAGQTLGRVLRIDEGRAPDAMRFGEQVMMARAADTAIATPISPSDMEIRAQVTLTVEIK